MLPGNEGQLPSLLCQKNRLALAVGLDALPEGPPGVLKDPRPVEETLPRLECALTVIYTLRLSSLCFPEALDASARGPYLSLG